MKMIDMASKIESAVIQCEQIADLVTIVLTEVFDECKATDDDYFGKLLPYEHSFENVLIAAISLCREQRKELAEVSERLYQLSKSDKQTA